MDKPGRWDGIDKAWGNVYDQCCWGWRDPPDSEPEQQAVRAALLTVVDLFAAAIKDGKIAAHSSFSIASIRAHIVSLPDDPAGHPIDVPAAFALMMGDTPEVKT